MRAVAKTKKHATPKVELPPHLLELVAKLERAQAEGTLKFSHTVRDVTPKGYGPNE